MAAQKRERLSLSPYSCRGLLSFGDINCFNLMCPNLLALIFAELRRKVTGDLQLASCEF